MDKQTLKRLIDVAAGRAPADLRLKNCQVIDVFNKTVFPSDVLIAEGLIAGYGQDGFPEAAETFDANGAYLADGVTAGTYRVCRGNYYTAKYEGIRPSYRYGYQVPGNYIDGFGWRVVTAFGLE